MAPVTGSQTLTRRTSSMSDAGVDVAAKFEEILKSDPSLATAIAAMRTLILVLEKCSATTLQELVKLIKEASHDMKSQVDCSVSSVVSGCELFLRFITLASKLEEGVGSLKTSPSSPSGLTLFFSFRPLRRCEPSC